MYNSKAVMSLLHRGFGTTCFFLGLLAGVGLVTGCATSRSFPDKTGLVSAEIEGFHNDNGEAIVSLFSTDGGFPDNMAKAWHNLRLKIDSGRARAVFTSVPYGQYALCVLHDEDADSQMKSSWLGQPLEGFGFSGRPDYNFGPPDFADAAFILLSEVRPIVVRMRYDTVRKEKRNERWTGQAGHNK